MLTETKKQTMRRALFPGSFDPITLGHYDIIKRGIKLFDEVIVAIGVNSEKKYMFSLEDRKRFLEDTFKDEPKVKIVTYTGLTIDFCKVVTHNLFYVVCVILLISNSKKQLHIPTVSFLKLKPCFC